MPPPSRPNPFHRLHVAKADLRVVLEIPHARTCWGGSTGSPWILNASEPVKRADELGRRPRKNGVFGSEWFSFRCVVAACPGRALVRVDEIAATTERALSVIARPDGIPGPRVDPKGHLREQISPAPRESP